jgi:hypothetical protein
MNLSLALEASRSKSASDLARYRSHLEVAERLLRQGFKNKAVPYLTMAQRMVDSRLVYFVSA